MFFIGPLPLCVVWLRLQARAEYGTAQLLAPPLGGGRGQGARPRDLRDTKRMHAPGARLVLVACVRGVPAQAVQRRGPGQQLYAASRRLRMKARAGHLGGSVGQLAVGMWGWGVVSWQQCGQRAAGARWDSGSGCAGGPRQRREVIHTPSSGLRVHVGHVGMGASTQHQRQAACAQAWQQMGQGSRAGWAKAQGRVAPVLSPPSRSGKYERTLHFLGPQGRRALGLGTTTSQPDLRKRGTKRCVRVGSCQDSSMPARTSHPPHGSACAAARYHLRRTSTQRAGTAPPAC